MTDTPSPLFQTRFVPGPAIAMVGTRIIGLIQDDPRSPLVKRLWAAIDADLPFDELLELLTAEGLRGLPSLALVALEQDRVRVVARGLVVVAITTLDSGIPIAIDAAEVTTWIEQVERDVLQVGLHLADDLSEIGPFEVRGGFLPASRLEMTLRDQGSPAAERFVERSLDAMQDPPVSPFSPPVLLSSIDESAASPSQLPPTPPAWVEPQSPLTLVPQVPESGSEIEGAEPAGPVDEVETEDVDSVEAELSTALPVDADADRAMEAGEEVGDVVADEPLRMAERPLAIVPDPSEPLDVGSSDQSESDAADPARIEPSDAAEAELVEAEAEMSDEIGIEPSVEPHLGAKPEPTVLADESDSELSVEVESESFDSLLAEPSDDVEHEPSAPTDAYESVDEDSEPTSEPSDDDPETRENATVRFSEFDHAARAGSADAELSDRGADEAGSADEPAEPGVDSDDREKVGANDVSDDADGELSVDSYDHLFGATQFRSVETAAVHVVEDDDAESSADAPMKEQQLIAGIPGMGTSVAPSVADGSAGIAEGPNVSSMVDDGDHDGMTISLAELRAQAAGGKAVPTPTSQDESVLAVMVHAVRCGSDHLNPPHATTCRVCSAPIPDQGQVTVPRPVLGAFKFSTGEEQLLLRPMLIGRAPKVDGMLRDELPALIAVPSPTKEISGTHVEIRLEGWQVLVIDRQSTNGTAIRLPGRDAQRLHPGEPFPITPGTVITLADEVDITYEVVW